MPRGLYANINAKRKRIKAGSGERMRKPGTKGAPTAKAFKDSAKTAKKKMETNRKRKSSILTRQSRNHKEMAACRELSAFSHQPSARGKISHPFCVQLIPQGLKRNQT